MRFSRIVRLRYVGVTRLAHRQMVRGGNRDLGRQTLTLNRHQRRAGPLVGEERMPVARRESDAIYPRATLTGTLTIAVRRTSCNIDNSRMAENVRAPRGWRNCDGIEP